MSITALLLGTAILSSTPSVDAPPVVREVVLSELITNPETFDGTTARTSGVMILDEGGAILYPDFGAAGDASIDNSIWLSGNFYWDGDYQALRHLNQQAVVVKGEFKVGHQGHLGSWPAGLRDVDQIVVDRSVQRPPFWVLFGSTTSALFGLTLLIPVLLAMGYWTGLHRLGQPHRR